MTTAESAGDGSNAVAAGAGGKSGRWKNAIVLSLAGLFVLLWSVVLPLVGLLYLTRVLQ